VGRYQSRLAPAKCRASFRPDVAAPSFVVKLSDLEHGPKKVTFEIPEEWLARTLADAGATTRGKPGELAVELSKNGKEVLVRGRASVEVTVPCVVTLDPLPFDLKPEILLVLEPRADEGKKKKGPSPSPTGTSPKVPKKRGKKARFEDETELSEEDAARDTFSGDEIVLDDFIREFILLEIPPYPRRSDLPSPEESLSSRPLVGPLDASKPIDPRLLPLQGILKRLRGED